MKNKISEYLDYSVSEKQELWNNATFVFDANVLLNLYRYSAKTRKVLLEALERYSANVWLPYHAIYEFMRKRRAIIQEKIDDNETFKKDIDTFADKIRGGLRADQKDVDSLKTVMQNWLKKYNESNPFLSSLNTNDDEILSKILEIFNDDRTGEKYDEEKRKELQKEGMRRIGEKIPPGYLDAKKDNSNECGDYFIWQAILDYAKKNLKNIIFVTNDQKEDWWEVCKGKTIGPRIELRKEFFDYTKHKFHMYTMHSFLDEYEKQTAKKISDSIRTEVERIDQRYNPIKSGFSSIADMCIPKSEIQQLIDANQSKGYQSILDKITEDVDKFQAIRYSGLLHELEKKWNDCRGNNYRSIISDDISFEPPEPPEPPELSA